LKELNISDDIIIEEKEDVNNYDEKLDSKTNFGVSVGNYDLVFMSKKIGSYNNKQDFSGYKNEYTENVNDIFKSSKDVMKNTEEKIEEKPQTYSENYKPIKINPAFIYHAENSDDIKNLYTNKKNYSSFHEISLYKKLDLKKDFIALPVQNKKQNEVYSELLSENDEYLENGKYLGFYTKRKLGV